MSRYGGYRECTPAEFNAATEEPPTCEADAAPRLQREAEFWSVVAICDAAIEWVEHY